MRASDNVQSRKVEWMPRGSAVLGWRSSCGAVEVVDFASPFDQGASECSTVNGWQRRDRGAVVNWRFK